MKKSRFAKKMMALILSASIAIGLMPVVSNSNLENVKAAGSEYTKTVACIGTSVIKNPDSPGDDVQKEWSGSIVYYGKYEVTNYSISSHPKYYYNAEYRVLDNGTTEYSADGMTKTMLLDYNNDLDIDTRKFDNDNSKKWDESYLRSYLNGDKFVNNSKLFTNIEKNAITESTKENASSNDGDGASMLEWTPLHGDKVFVLDAKEVTRESYGYKNTVLDSNTRWKGDSNWMLRSSSINSENNARGCVYYGTWYGDYWFDDYLNNDYLNGSSHYYIGGKIDNAPDDVTDISPAFNINISSVLFTTDVGKSEWGHGNGYKFTLKDNDIIVNKTNAKDIIKRKNNVFIPYTISGNDSTNVTQLSYLVTDKEYTASDVKVISYGKLADITSNNLSGNVKLNLNDINYQDGNHIYIIAEDVNDKKETDYAGLPLEITTDEMVEENTNYLTFTADEAGSTVKLDWISGSDVMYSTDEGENWKNYNKEEITLDKVGDKVSFKGRNVQTDGKKHFSMTGKINASGSVTSLTDQNGSDKKVTLTDRCYAYMFFNCSSLLTAPELPAENLSKSCYLYMFGKCSGLTSAPKLPATKMTESCYLAMFDECTGLEKAPDLPSEDLEANCYAVMFNNCTSLKVAPELPAMIMKKGCYEGMFQGCSSLQKAPELPAMKLAEACYGSMFSDCTAIKEAPELPATELAKTCYCYMFANCTGLTYATALPAMQLEEYCYDAMFTGCTGLKGLPQLPATNPAKCCYVGMFEGCTGLSIKDKEDGSNNIPWKINFSTASEDWEWKTCNMFKDCKIDLFKDSNAPEQGKIYYTTCNHKYKSDTHTCVYCGEKQKNTVTINIPVGATHVSSSGALTQTVSGPIKVIKIKSDKNHYFSSQNTRAFDAAYFEQYGIYVSTVGDNAEIEIAGTPKGNVTADISMTEKRHIDEKLRISAERPKTSAGKGYLYLNNNKYYGSYQMEYRYANAIENGWSDWSGWQDCPWDYRMEAAPGKYQVRYKERIQTYASEPTTVVVTEYEKYTASTPNASFTAMGSDSGKLTGVNSSMQYSTDGGKTWVTITGSEVSLNNLIGIKDIRIKVYGTSDYYQSKVQTITITKSEAPDDLKIEECSSSGDNDGKITGFSPDKTYEYKLLSDVAWKNVTGTSIDKLAAGKYLIRVKANGTVLASENTEVTVSVDSTFPVVEIKCNSSTWKEFINTISFGHFFNEPKSVSITASDNKTSDLAIDYYLSDSKLSKDDVTSGILNWTRYNGSFNLNRNSKQYIYAKTTDKAGNTTIVNSDGIVIYTDSAEKGNVSFTRLQTKDVQTDVTVGENTVSKIKINNTEVKEEDIPNAVEIKNDTFVFKARFLNTIKPGTYTVTVSYNPMGEKYVNNDTNDVPKDSVITLNINRIDGRITVNADNLNKKYDGELVEKPVISTDNDTADGKVKYEYKKKEADDSTYTTAAPKDAGEYIVKITVAADDTYTEAVAYGEFTITQKPVNIKWSDNEFTYDGKAHKAQADVISDDIVGKDKVSVITTGEQTNAGKYTATATGVDNENYVLSTEADSTYDFSIARKPIKVTADSVQKHVNADDPKFTYTVEANALVTGDTLKDITVERTKGEECGEYDIAITAKANSNPNYEITTVDGKLTIADHTYSDTTYTWSADNTECTAVRKCTYCDKTDTETAKSKAEVTQNNSCTLPELTKYTVSFKNENGTAFKAQTKENVQTKEATGHKWDGGVQTKAPTYTDEGEMTYTCESCSATKTESIEKLKLNEYDILEGADTTHVLKVDEVHAIRVNCEVEYFLDVMVDGKTVDPKYYTVKSGSTIVTFTKEFLDSLSVGEHEVKFLFTNGTAKATVTVVEKKAQETKPADKDKTDINKPATSQKPAQQTVAPAKKPAANQKKATRTGDDNPAMMVLILMLLGGAAAVGYSLKRRKAQ